jgi:hypothetical protein
MKINEMLFHGVNMMESNAGTKEIFRESNTIGKRSGSFINARNNRYGSEGDIICDGGRISNVSE